MEPSAALVDQFRGVTNADESLAKQLLRDSALDLEAAITSFFAIQDAGGLPSSPEASNSHDHSVSAPDPVISDEPVPLPTANPPPQAPRVQPPLPQLVDQLIPDNAHEPDADVGEPARHPFAENNRLADLFRPPHHLNTQGTWTNVMIVGNAQKRWILVNIQSHSVFACHCLNRDIWSDADVQQLLQAHFIFWQRDEGTQNAARYKRFYPVDVLPHVALIDPRSGERLRVWSGDGINRINLLTELQDFVTRNSLEDNAEIRGRTQQAASTRNVPSSRSTANTAQPNGSGVDVATDHSMDLTEDDQLAAAIAASMENRDVDMSAVREARMDTAIAENGVDSNGTVDTERETSRLLSATDPTLTRNRSLRAQQDHEYKQSLALDRAIEQSRMDEIQRREKAEEAKQKHVAQLEEAREQKRRRVPDAPPPELKDGVRELMIRLPDGKRMQRRFYATDNVGHVYDYIESEVDGMKEGRYELMQAYPKKSFVERELTLEALPNKAALVVHLKN